MDDPANQAAGEPSPRAAAALRALARRLGLAGIRGVRAVHAALGLYLSLSLLAAALALWGFAELADEVLDGEIDRFDAAIVSWIRASRTDWLDWAALELTALGSAVVLATISIIVSVLLWLLGRRRHVALIWIAAAGGVVLNQVMKVAFGRQRPAGEALVQTLSLSFPSGHAMNATIFYTVIAYTVGRVVGPGGGRTLVHAFGALVILLVGWTRIYLGVHYPSDVLAGYAVGYAWAILCAVLLETWAARAGREAAASAGSARSGAAETRPGSGP